MAAVEVVADRPEALEDAVEIVAGEQFLDQVTPEAQLDLGDTAHVRQLESQHRRAVLQRPPVHLGPGLAGVDDRDDTQHVVSELGDGNDSIAALQRPAVVTQNGVDELLRSCGGDFGYGSGLSGPAQAMRVPKGSSMATGSPVS